MKLSNILSRRNKILLRELVITEFKLRYQGSILGYVWSLLKPLMLFAILYVVFIKFLRFGSDGSHFAVQLLLGIVMWTFFTEATSQGMQAIVNRGDLIRKINFPKYIIVISGTISALINMLLNLVVVLVFMVINGVQFTWTILLLPLSILELYVIALGLAFLLSAAYVKYRDIAHLWDVFMQGLFYATPIIYPVTMVSTMNVTAAKILLLSPIAQTIQDARHNTVSHTATTTWAMVGSEWARMIPFVIVIVLVIAAVVYFRHSQKYFAENV